MSVVDVRGELRECAGNESSLSVCLAAYLCLRLGCFCCKLSESIQWSRNLRAALEEGTKYSACFTFLAHPGRRQHSKWYKITQTMPLSGVFSNTTGCVPKPSHLLAAPLLPASSPAPFCTGTVQGGTEPNG